MTVPRVKASRELLGLCVERGGYLGGARLAQFITEWAMAQVDLGHAPSPQEFADWWKDSERTAYRRLAAFRDAFPEAGPKGVPSDLFAPEPLGHAETLEVGVGAFA